MVGFLAVFPVSRVLLFLSLHTAHHYFLVPVSLSVLITQCVPFNHGPFGSSTKADLREATNP